MTRLCGSMQRVRDVSLGCACVHFASFQFVVNNCFAKIVNTRSKDAINDCQLHFHFDSISDIDAKRKQKFLNKYESYENLLCSVVCST